MPSLMLAQGTLFDYYPNDEDLGDLIRLKYALEYLPSDTLLTQMMEERGNGRNEYPIPSMFGVVVGQFVLQRMTVAQMRRELSGNPMLRKVLRFNDQDRKMRDIGIIPSTDAFTSFYDNLIRHQDLIDDMYAILSKKVFETIPEYGIYAAGDGKYFDSYTPNQPRDWDDIIPGDRRSPSGSTYSIKEYIYTGTDGKKHTKKETHYGFRKHTIVDALTELPIATILSSANEDEKGHMLTLICDLFPEILQRMKELSLDRGYDSTDLLQFIRSKQIIPIVDKRMMKKGNPLIRYKETQFYYDDGGYVFFYDDSIEESGINQDTGHPLQYVRAKYLGYDKQRKCLRYSYNGKTQRIYIKDDPRVFNEVARHSKKFKRQYDLRTSVERYHGRQDRDFGFENHTIRNLEKMRLMTTLGDCIMLALALAHHDLGQTNYAALMDFNIPGL